MAGFSVNLDGQKIKISPKANLEELKAKFGDDAEELFKDLDDGNGILDTAEISTLKTRLSEKGYTIELSQDGKSTKNAYNQTIQVIKGRYNIDSLKSNFNEENKVTVERGDNLWKIAKAQLAEEGLQITERAINDRIAQIAAINNIPNVNNIAIGTELIVKLTEEGVNKVKAAADESSAAAFGVAAPAKVKRNTNKQANRQEAGQDEVQNAAQNEDFVSNLPESEFEITPNGLNMGKGVPVDKDGNELKSFKDPKFKADGSVMKYTKGDTVMYQITVGAVKIAASSIEEVLELKKNFDEVRKKIKKAPNNETEEAKAERVKQNAIAFRELIEVTGGNRKVVENLIKMMQKDDFVDRTSDEVKGLVQDILLTKDPKMIQQLRADNKLFENDETASLYAIGMWKEIRDKERAGIRLSDKDIQLKSTLNNDIKFSDTFKIPADEENGVFEKHMRADRNGEIYYRANAGEGDRYIIATDKELLDEFCAKFKAADSDEKKKALFKEYANTNDKELKYYLMGQIISLKAADEDVITLINNSSIEELDGITDNGEALKSKKAIIKAYVDRVKDIYLNSDKGNLENIVYLGKTFQFIDAAEDLSAEDKLNLKLELVESYFDVTVTKDEEGNEVNEYSFNPPRRLTYDEMYEIRELVSQIGGKNTLKMWKAITDSVGLEDMGRNRSGEASEFNANYSDTREHFNTMIDKMETPEEVIDFIENKMVNFKDGFLDYNKIMEKFPDNEDIMKVLLKYVGSDSWGSELWRDYATISPENRMKLLNLVIQKDGDRYVFDPDALPKGVTTMNVIYTLPQNCNESPLKDMYEAIYLALSGNDVSNLEALILNHNTTNPFVSNCGKIIDAVKKAEKGSDLQNRLLDLLMLNHAKIKKELAGLYDIVSDSQKAKLIEYKVADNNGARVVVRKGDTIDKIVKNYLINHLDKFPYLQKSVTNDTIIDDGNGGKVRKKWTKERINEALNKYLKDFRKHIVDELGIDPTKLKPGQIIDLDKVNWEAHQPGWVDYKMFY